MERPSKPAPLAASPYYSKRSSDTFLLISTLNLRRHVRNETNAIDRSLAAQQPHFGSRGLGIRPGTQIDPKTQTAMLKAD